MNELKLRIIGSGSSPAKHSDEDSNYVALIFESDTVYGRSLRYTIADELKHGTTLPLRVEFFSYFGGLDGQLPGTKLSKKIKSSAEESGGTASDRQPNDAAKGSAGQNEVADGQGQFDYLRRLAGHNPPD